MQQLLVVASAYHAMLIMLLSAVPSTRCIGPTDDTFLVVALIPRGVLTAVMIVAT